MNKLAVNMFVESSPRLVQGNHRCRDQDDEAGQYVRKGIYCRSQHDDVRLMNFYFGFVILL